MLIFILSYCIGSIPFGLIYGRYFRNLDIRTLGSGNIGTSNAMRVGGWRLAAITFASDALKGFLPVWLWGTPDTAPGIALSVLLGSLFSCFLRFRGGKGVAATFGSVLALSPLTALTLACIWIGTFLPTRVSGMAALVATASLPFLPFHELPFWWSLSTVVLIFYAHRKNIHEWLSAQSDIHSK